MKKNLTFEKNSMFLNITVVRSMKDVTIDLG